MNAKRQMTADSSRGFRPSQTSAPSGSFETSAPLDARAAMIRNQTWVVGKTAPNWDDCSSASPQSPWSLNQER